MILHATWRSIHPFLGLVGPFTFTVVFNATPSPAQGPLEPHPVVDARTEPDFNGDGFADLVVGVPLKNDQAGAVHVIYGSSSGLSAARNQLWTQDSPGIADVAEAGDRFGSGLTWGDFNGDGFDDLAVGVQLEDLEAIVDAGAVHVIYGSSAGLTSAGNQLWTQDTGLHDDAEADDEFGAILTSGDFNQDGFDDLVVGVPLEDLESFEDEGVAHVIYGSAGGLTSARNQLWSQKSPGVRGAPQAGDQFGNALTIGDFNGEGFDDLAIGVPRDNLAALSAGAVNVIYGSAAGLSSVGSQIWHQDTPGILDVAEPVDGFGGALTSADFNNDRFSDLAISVLFEGLGTVAGAGAVHVIYGSASGLASRGNQFWTQDSPGILDRIEATVEGGEGFGRDVAAGDFNGDGFRDLAISVPLESLEDAERTVVNAGALNVIYGSAHGLVSARNQFWNQDAPGIQEVAEVDDFWGGDLATGDYNGDGAADIAVTAPFEDLGGFTNAGAVNVIYGSRVAGLSASGNQLWTQGSPGMLGVIENNDGFGQVTPSR